MGILDILKKKQPVQEETTAPDLMAADPASGGSVDLMASDPLNTILAAPVMEEAPKIIEEPGIEQQIIMETPTSEAPVTPVIEQSVPVNPPAPSMDAFGMAMPAPEPVIEKMVVEPATAPEPVTPVNTVSNKFCTDCGTPNDPLNKFCVSCGKAIE